MKTPGGFFFGERASKITYTKIFRDEKFHRAHAILGSPLTRTTYFMGTMSRARGLITDCPLSGMVEQPGDAIFETKISQTPHMNH